MAKQMCTIEIDPEDLKDIIEFRLKAIQRAINTESDTQIQNIRKTLMRDLQISMNSINQGTLPGVKTK